MSIVICADCDAAVDSDEDPDCFVYVGNMRRLHGEITLCRSCRDRRENNDEQLRYETETGAEHA